MTQLNRSLPILFTALVAGCTGDGSDVPTTNDEWNDMLDGMGFTTDLGPRTDSAGTPLPPAWHPLRKQYAAFFPKREIYVTGVNVGTTGMQLEGLFDDGEAGYPLLPDLISNPDESWQQAQYKNAINADIDGDGMDEIVVVYYAAGSSTLKYILIDQNDAVPAQLGTLDVGAVNPFAAPGLDQRAQPDLAKGDLDGDGQDEIAVGFGRLYVVSDLGGAAQSLATRSYADNNDVMVAIGNADRDAVDELVVTHTETSGALKGFFEIFNDTVDAPTQTGDLVVTDANSGVHPFGEARVAIGDVDGDRVGEILFHGRRNHDSWWGVFLMRFDATEPPATAYSFRTALHWIGYLGEVPRTLVPVDLDGNGVDEVYAWDRVLTFKADNTVARFPNDGTSIPIYSRARRGNVDSDRREELVGATWTGIDIWGLDGQDIFVRKHRLPDHGGVAHDSPALALPNLDADSAIVRYDGAHELLFTAPHIVALINSPPYHRGIGQDIEATQAVFGQTNGTQVVESISMGFKVGFSIGYEYENDLFQTGYSVKATFETEMDFFAKESSTIQNYHSYKTAPGEDKVVYTTIPYDVYYYTVVSSPKPSDVGRVITVNLPRKEQMLGASIDFFNANNGVGQDIDDSILGHELGNVASYPTIDDRDLILGRAAAENPGYLPMWNGPLQVDQSGSNTIGIIEDEGSGRGASMRFDATFEFESKTGGFTSGTSVGFHYGESFEITTSQGAYFEGTVGGIPGDEYVDNAYCYGLMVYPQTYNGERFINLNWWQQPTCAAP